MGKFHGTGKGYNRGGKGAIVHYVHGYNVTAGTAKAAGDLIAREAQKKIDERHAKAAKPKTDGRRLNSRYSDAFVELAIQLMKEHTVAEVSKKLKVRPATLTNWRDGVTRAVSTAAVAKRIR